MILKIIQTMLPIFGPMFVSLSDNPDASLKVQKIIFEKRQHFREN